MPAGTRRGGAHRAVLRPGASWCRSRPGGAAVRRPRPAKSVPGTAPQESSPRHGTTPFGGVTGGAGPGTTSDDAAAPRLRSGDPGPGRSPRHRCARPRPAAPARPSARPGGGTTLTPYDEHPFGEPAARCRLRTGPDARVRAASAGHPVRLRPYLRGLAWLAPVAAVGSLTAGIVLAHGLLLAGGLVLAGLWGHLAADGRGPRGQRVTFAQPPTGLPPEKGKRPAAAARFTGGRVRCRGGSSRPRRRTWHPAGTSGRR